MRLAESERIRIDLGHSLGSPAAIITMTDQDHREQMIAMARRVAFLAGEALHLARRDIDASRSRGRGICDSSASGLRPAPSEVVTCRH